MPRRTLTALAALTALLTACATPSPHARGLGVQRAEAAPADASQALAPGIYDVRTGQPLSREALYDALAAHTYLIVGEAHDDPWHHRVQRDLYAGVSARVANQLPSGRLMLGMEMVQHPYQQALDGYVSGALSEKQMLKEVEWRERWGFDPALYAPLWRAARAQGAPVLGLNAPRELSRRVAKVGLARLTEAERALLPSRMNMEDAAHRAWVEQVFISHGMTMDEEALTRFYAAQVLWDETMAERAYQAMRTRGGPGDRMLIVAGSGHVQRGWGIPSRLQAHLSSPHQVVTLIPVSAPGGPPTSLEGPTGATQADLNLWREQRYADYVWVQ